ncbi:beta-lactamase family protein [Cavenderia fasciculata]|uniref:Beta-lactamase family protein n=1 Tax=Cavenderia fasciculata TaxID=261658 RepID=F4PL80_CACFS|nr:beta-lactamase family protein [Cavenderia fasciculata]EGG23302.1 beta-lactamase family protein [Cavenderia fasciculata]|eukprot:XP_004361153.1 beta-lactamase family protein [Cavenderia fasciculata]
MSGLKNLLFSKKTRKILLGSAIATGCIYQYNSSSSVGSINQINNNSNNNNNNNETNQKKEKMGILGNILFNIRNTKANNVLLCEVKSQPDLMNPSSSEEEEREQTPLWKQDSYVPGASTTLNAEEQRDIASREVVSWMSQQLIPGVSVCAMVRGDTVFKAGFGYADVENAIPVTPDTKMRIASISKALTSAAVGLLIEDGKLDVDATVQTYVPEFPINPAYPETAPTVRQVASHIGGIRHYRRGATTEIFSVQQYVSDAVRDNPDKLPPPLAIFVSDPWIDADKSAPGQTYNYSTFGYTLIGTIIERAAKTDFISFMKNRVFQRCGMYDTYADQHNTIISNRSRQYALTGGKNTNNRYSSTGVSVNPQLVNAELANNSYKYAGGGILSTSQDICRFGTYIISGQLLKRSTLDIIFHTQQTNNGKPTDYAIGWSVKPNHQIKNRQIVGDINPIDNTSTRRVTDTLDNKIIYHTGAAVGGSSIIVVVPKYGVVVCVLANLEGVKGIIEFGTKLANIFVPKGDQQQQQKITEI